MMIQHFKCSNCDADLFDENSLLGSTNDTISFQFRKSFPVKNKIVKVNRRRKMGVVCNNCEQVLGISCADNDILPTRIRLDINKSSIK